MTYLICTIILIAGLWDIAATFKKPEDKKLCLRNRNLFLAAAVIIFVLSSESFHMLYRGY